MDDKKEVMDKTIREFPEILLNNGYKIIPRLKEFSSGVKSYQVLSLNLYDDKKFVKSIALPLDKISQFAKALHSIERQLNIVEPICGNCCFWRTDKCWYGRGAPILKTDRFARTCVSFVPKTQRHKLRETACLTRHMLRHGLTEEEKKESDRYITDVTECRITRKLDNGYYLVK